MNIEIWSSLIAAILVAGTPLILTALGELVTEKAGVLNLGAEGLMSVGALAGFLGAMISGDPWLGALAGILAGSLLSLLFSFLTLVLMANQVATGLALSIFGVGLSAFLGKSIASITLPAPSVWAIPFLSELPFWGPALFQHQPMIYLSWGLVLLVHLMLYRTRPGLVLRAIGESPVAAHTLGYPVFRYRLFACLFGGALAGLSGAFLSVFVTLMWIENGVVAGRGWIALALVVFATWRPLRIFLGAYLFGGVMVIEMFMQSSGLNIQLPVQLFAALPYLATIFVLVLISRNALSVRLHSPVSLGQPFKSSD